MLKPHEDLLVIEANIGANCRVTIVMVENDSIVDVLYYNAFLKMGYTREQL